MTKSQILLILDEKVVKSRLKNGEFQPYDSVKEPNSFDFDVKTTMKPKGTPKIGFENPFSKWNYRC